MVFKIHNGLKSLIVLLTFYFFLH